jgi:tetratricopeptide (TPR) repeat protein
MMRRSVLVHWFMLLLGVLLFVGASVSSRQQKRIIVSPEIQVALPLFVQVFMAGGDRFLAANLGAIRALVTETAKMHPDEYKILGKVQVDASWLNPAHEDNYYIASAILPWSGQIDAAQTVLRRASLARPFDYQPSFYYAFNLLHFKGDVAGASEWLRTAAAKLPDDDERLAMENLAARWLDKAEDLGMAIAVVESMAKQAKRKDFRNYLLQRAQRLRDLLALRQAAETFRQQSGQPAQTLDQLVGAGLMAKLPVDPFGTGYALDAGGIPVFDSAKKR